jgi:hypothetical protein
VAIFVAKSLSFRTWSCYWRSRLVTRSLCSWYQVDIAFVPKQARAKPSPGTDGAGARQPVANFLSDRTRPRLPRLEMCRDVASVPQSSVSQVERCTQLAPDELDSALKFTYRPIGQCTELALNKLAGCSALSSATVPLAASLCVQLQGWLQATRLQAPAERPAASIIDDQIP